MAYQGTNLVPSSQVDSCNMHGFAAAEVGKRPYAECGASFSDAEALGLHMKGHDFGNVPVLDRAISNTYTGYGTSSGYGVDTYVGDVAMNNRTGYVDSSCGPFENSVGATPYAGHDFNPSYATALPVGNTVGPGSVAMNNCPGYVDTTSGPFEHSVGATPYAGHDFTLSYAAALPVGNTVGPGSVAMKNCPGYVDTSSGPFEHSVGATPYAGRDYNPAYATAPSVGNTVGPGPGTGPWMPPLPLNTQTPQATAGSSAHLGARRSVCNHPNCNRSFGRPSDLARHAKKHELNPVKYSCPVPGCQYVGPCGFLRHDKLLSHGRNAHGVEL